LFSSVPSVKSVVNVILVCGRRPSRQCIHRRTQKDTEVCAAAGRRSFCVLLCILWMCSAIALARSVSGLAEVRRESSSHAARLGAAGSASVAARATRRSGPCSSVVSSCRCGGPANDNAKPANRVASVSVGVPLLAGESAPKFARSTTPASSARTVREVVLVSSAHCLFVGDDVVRQAQYLVRRLPSSGTPRVISPLCRGVVVVNSTFAQCERARASSAREVISHSDVGCHCLPVNRRRHSLGRQHRQAVLERCARSSW
jgi:hypothetical protein